MSTTITDFSKFAAALVTGEGLSKASYREMLKPSLHIPTARQFPAFQRKRRLKAAWTVGRAE